MVQSGGGLPQCTAHGLKKVAATICANMGATDRQLMALFEKQANVYTLKDEARS